MKEIYNRSWVDVRVGRTIQVWNGCAAQPAPGGRRYDRNEQQEREKAYDQALRAVEREVKRAPRLRKGRLEAQNRIVALFARFSANALDLEKETVQILTDDFLPAGA